MKKYILKKIANIFLLSGLSTILVLLGFISLFNHEKQIAIKGFYILIISIILYFILVSIYYLIKSYRFNQQSHIIKKHIILFKRIKEDDELDWQRLGELSLDYDNYAIRNNVESINHIQFLRVILDRSLFRRRPTGFIYTTKFNQLITKCLK